MSTGQDVGFIRCHRQFQLTLMGGFKGQEPFKGCEYQTLNRHTKLGLSLFLLLFIHSVNL